MVTEVVAVVVGFADEEEAEVVALVDVPDVTEEREAVEEPDEVEILEEVVTGGTEEDLPEFVLVTEALEALLELPVVVGLKVVRPVTADAVAVT